MSQVIFDRAGQIWIKTPGTNENCGPNGSGYTMRLTLGPAAGSAEPNTSTAPGSEIVLYLPEGYEPDALTKSRVINSIYFSIRRYASSTKAESRRVVLGYAEAATPNTPAFDSVTWNTRPTPRAALKTIAAGSTPDSSWRPVNTLLQTEAELNVIKRALDGEILLMLWPEVVDQIGTNIDESTAYETIFIGGNSYATSDYAPHLQFNLGGELYSTLGTQNTSGSIDPAAANTFAWEYHKNGFGLSDAPVQASAVFKWTSIADGEEHTFAIEGATNAHTVAPNNFPSTGITWQVFLTDTEGNETETPVYTLETGDRATFAAPVSPAGNAFLDEKEAIPFSWALENALGSEATGTELQWRVRETGTWAALATITGAGTSYTAPADTFPGADLEWRARGINQDGVASPWSEAALFTTKDPLSVITESAPRNGQYKDEKSAITFTWSATNALPGYTPQKSELEWKTPEGEWTPLAIVTEGGRSYTAPENTFPSAVITWRVRAYNNDDMPGAWWEATFTTEDELTTCTATSPNGIFLDRGQATTFQYRARNATSLITGFDLEYSADEGENWVRFATIRGSSAQSYTAPANTFPAAEEIQWRVRGYNNDDMPGAWSNVLRFATIDAITSATPISPSNGVSMDETVPITFSWSTRNALGSEPAGAELQYALGEENPAWVNLGSVTGNEKRYTAAANTFPGSIISWRVRAINQSGVAGEWASAVFTTLDTPSVSAPVSPIGTIENTDDPMVLTWNTSNDSGTRPTAAEVEYSYDGEDWELLGETDGTQRLEIEGGVIDAGTVYWRVRSYNRNGYAGPWSEAASFAAYAAPKIRALFTDTMPYTTLTWQVDGQLAYELRVDGETYGPYFGAGVRSFTLPEPLEDGGHTAALRAQNQFGLWSKWYEIAFSTQSETAAVLLLEAEGGTDVTLTWTGGGSTVPVITRQPVSMAATSGLICFSAAAEGEGLRYQWEALLPNAAAWAIQPAGVIEQLWTHAAQESYDGMRIRCRVISPGGEALSDEAVYTYAEPESAPVILIAPEDVTKDTGTVRIWCGATGSAYRWYRCVTSSSEEEDPDAIAVTDNEGGFWHLPSGAGSAGTLGITSDGGGLWNLPSGDGGAGTIGVTDGISGLWYLPSGSGVPEFVDMGVSTPYILFPAGTERDGNRFFCLVTNSAGAVSSEICEYTYGEPEIPEVTGDYTVYRDGKAIARVKRQRFVDRVILGEHEYQVIERTENNDAIRSNTVSAEAAVETLTIAPLAGGEWLTLGLSERANRDFQYQRSRNTAYTWYSGAKYPAAEVSGQEDLSGSFDAAYTYQNRAEAAALEAMIGQNIILKSERGVVIIGPLAGFDRGDRDYYRAYTFNVRHTDWRDFVNES